MHLIISSAKCWQLCPGEMSGGGVYSLQKSLFTNVSNLCQRLSIALKHENKDSLLQECFFMVERYEAILEKMPIVMK